MPRNGPRSRRLIQRGLILLVGVCALTFAGCAAFSNPVGEGIPVRRLPAEFLGTPKEESKPIPLTTLRQKPPDVYRLAAGDILGIYIEGVLGDKNQPLPVRFPEQGNLPPGLGYPIPVREDGTLPLPLIDPVLVKNMTVAEAQAAIMKAYSVDKKILQPGRERVLVSLMRPRQIRVQVVREDSGSLTVGAAGVIGNARRGTGAAIDLPAYENDVLNALTRTGGLPGLDATNEVVIQRGYVGADGLPTKDSAGGTVVRIPLRLPEGEPVPFRPEDIILETGDIVFIEARDTEVYYTGGLLQPRQFILPRDYDLRVVDAIALAGGPLVNGLQNVNNLSGSIAQTGIGSPSPSRVSVLRRTKDYGQVTIIVDLNRALNDPRENLLIQAGDVIIMQETLGEAFTRYFNSAFRYNLLGIFPRHRDLIGTATLNVP